MRQKRPRVHENEDRRWAVVRSVTEGQKPSAEPKHAGSRCHTPQLLTGKHILQHGEVAQVHVAVVLQIRMAEVDPDAGRRPESLVRRMGAGG